MKGSHHVSNQSNRKTPEPSAGNCAFHLDRTPLGSCPRFRQHALQNDERGKMRDEKKDNPAMEKSFSLALRIELLRSISIFRTDKK